MHYYGAVYRPPSEAYSLIVQVTYGCSHNRCAFCDMYDDKHFAIGPMEEVREDFEMARRSYKKVERVFLADGDALIRKASELYTILDTIRELFPECERVTSYASPSSIRLRTDEELQTLRAKGRTMVYMGLESGSDKVLTLMRKGHPAAEIIEMGQQVRRNGLALSVTAIPGLGGAALLAAAAIFSQSVSRREPVRSRPLSTQASELNSRLASCSRDISREKKATVFFIFLLVFCGFFSSFWVFFWCCFGDFCSFSYFLPVFLRLFG